MAFPSTLPDALRLPILRRLAEDGCPRAQYELWDGAPEDRSPEALGWLRRAAQTLPVAQLRLATVERDRGWPTAGAAERQARRLEARAALAGHPQGTYAQAWWHLRGGDDDPAVLARARPRLERALRAGVGEAGWDLAVLVETWAGDLERVERFLEDAQTLLEDHDDGSVFSLEYVRWARPRLLRWRARGPTEWRALARAGNVEARTLVGLAHAFGRSVPFDLEEARAWWEQAADGGGDDARVALAFLSHSDPGTVELRAGAEHAALAAASGDPTALWLAGRLDPHSRWPSVHRAARWWRRGARAGDARCAREYALCFLLGRGVRPSARSQVRWLRVAARGGSPAAQLLLAEHRRDGTGVRRNRREATAWRRLAARRGNPDGQLVLGVALHEGAGVRRDDRECVRWYRRAAAHGERHAQSNLGLCYKHGHGVRRNARTARRWFEEAAWIHGDGRAAFHLGGGFEDGLFGPADPLEAARWYRFGASVGDADSLENLGVFHHNGRPVPKDLEFAALLYRAAATLGNRWAMHLLGLSYRDGDGVRASRRTARAWFRRSASLGEREAKAALRAIDAAPRARGGR